MYKIKWYTLAIIKPINKDKKNCAKKVKEFTKQRISTKRLMAGGPPRLEIKSINQINLNIGRGFSNPLFKIIFRELLAM